MCAEAFTGPYRLIIQADLPEIVVEGELFEGRYIITNDSGVPFPGIHTGVIVSWAELEDYTVYHPTDVGPLDVGASQEFPFTETPSSSGRTNFTVNLRYYHAVDGFIVEFNLEDGRIITPGQLFASVRAKSREEALQEKLLNAIKKSTKSQDRLAWVEIFLGFIATIIAILQILMILN